jgi:hypothetical protein
MRYAAHFFISGLIVFSSTAHSGKPELNKRYYPSSDIQLDIVEAELSSLTNSTLSKTSIDADCQDVSIGNSDDTDPFKNGGFGDTNISVTNVTVYNICR